MPDIVLRKRAKYSKSPAKRGAFFVDASVLTLTVAMRSESGFAPRGSARQQGPSTRSFGVFWQLVCKTINGSDALEKVSVRLTDRQMPFILVAEHPISTRS